MEADLHVQVVDYAAKGAYVGLEGVEKVEGARYLPNEANRVGWSSAAPLG